MTDLRMFRMIAVQIPRTTHHKLEDYCYAMLLVAAFTRLIYKSQLVDDRWWI